MAKLEIATNIKGSFDADPTEKSMRNRVTDILRNKFEAYGYLPVETSMINYLSLLTYKYDPEAEIVREIYKIRDQGDRDLGLRFDLTVPFCKYIAMNQQLRMPFKRYEIGKVWRNGPVKLGRAREFYQCDVDVVGLGGAHIEAELIIMAVEAYKEMGLDVVIKYNNRKLLPYSDAVIACIDRMAKISREELVKDLSAHMTKPEAETLVDNLKNTPKCDELIELEKCLADLGVLDSCEYTPYLARGLNVYTGTVFEVFARNSKMTSSLGGGGRYDKIIGNFVENGKEYPAVGISFGLEPIMAVIMEQQASKAQPLIDAMLVPLGTESWCQGYANTLRKQGQKVLVYLGGKAIGKAIEYGASYGIKRVAIIGEDEVNGKAIVWKEVS